MSLFDFEGYYLDVVHSHWEKDGSCCFKEGALKCKGWCHHIETVRIINVAHEIAIIVSQLMGARWGIRKRPKGNLSVTGLSYKLTSVLQVTERSLV